MVNRFSSLKSISLTYRKRTVSYGAEWSGSGRELCAASDGKERERGKNFPLFYVLTNVHSKSERERESGEGEL
jgi:hypothetical protein